MTIVEIDAAKLSLIESGAMAGQSIAEGVALARDLVNMPPNVATPTKMAEIAEKIAGLEAKLKIIARLWSPSR